MESPATSPTPAGWSTEIFTTDNSPPLAGHRTPAAADHRLSDSPIPALEGVSAVFVFPLSRIITSKLTSVPDATLSGPQRREDEVALFARFVHCVSAVLLQLSPVDSLQACSRTPLRRYGEGMIQVCLGTPTINYPSRTRSNDVLTGSLQPSNESLRHFAETRRTGWPG